MLKKWKDWNLNEDILDDSEEKMSYKKNEIHEYLINLDYEKDIELIKKDARGDEYYYVSFKNKMENFDNYFKVNLYVKPLKDIKKLYIELEDEYSFYNNSFDISKIIVNNILPLEKAIILEIENQGKIDLGISHKLMKSDKCYYILSNNHLFLFSLDVKYEDVINILIKNIDNIFKYFKNIENYRVDPRLRDNSPYFANGNTLNAALIDKYFEINNIKIIENDTIELNDTIIVKSTLTKGKVLSIKYKNLNLANDIIYEIKVNSYDTFNYKAEDLYLIEKNKFDDPLIVSFLEKFKLKSLVHLDDPWNDTGYIASMYYHRNSIVFDIVNISNYSSNNRYVLDKDIEKAIMLVNFEKVPFDEVKIGDVFKHKNLYLTVTDISKNIIFYKIGRETYSIRKTRNPELEVIKK